jgi:hypothetical protein
MRIIAEVTYNFNTNAIHRDKHIQVITKITKDTYYCKDKGFRNRHNLYYYHELAFKKNKENIPFINTFGELTIFKTYPITEENYNKETKEIKQSILDNINAELVKAIETELIKRTKEINIL